MKLFKIISLFCLLNLNPIFVKTIIIGATPNPFASLLEKVRNDFKGKGYGLKIIEFSDYTLPNRVLEERELDANSYQHKSFLEEYNAQKGINLTPTTPVVIASIGIHDKTIKDSKNLKKGAKVAIPNDTTNESRALGLLEKAGLTELNQNTLKTPLGIKKNPRSFEFIELKAVQLLGALNDVDIAVINPNLALRAGLNPIKNIIFKEDKNSPCISYVVVRFESKDNEKTKTIDEILRSDKFRNIIDEHYKDVLIPVF